MGIAKILGLGEEAHRAIGALFLLLFLLGMLSTALYLSDGDVGGGLQVAAACSVTGLVPAIIFLSFSMRLMRQRQMYEALGAFLYRQQRTSVKEVSAQFGWTDQESEARIVEALSENKVQGHFDRGSGQFYFAGSQATMAFVAGCRSCGANAGIWVPRDRPTPCAFCGSDLRASTPEGIPPPVPPPQPYYPAPPPPPATAQPPVVPGAVAQPTPPQPYPMVAPVVAPAATPTAYPTVGWTPTPPRPPPPPAFDQGRRKTVRFLFFSMKPGAMKALGFVLLGAGMLFVGATIGVTYYMDSAYPASMNLICGAVMFIPMLLIGAALIYKAYVHDRYKAQLLEISDYIVTYRRIELLTLARKMNLPETEVRRIIDDILRFGLLEGDLTADGSEFETRLRPTDTQIVTACPYCRHPAINIQVIRGGSERCPYCKGIIYFTEAVQP